MEAKFLDRPNTTLDDISAVVGFSAALRMSAWYGGGMPVYIPTKIDEAHMLARIMGASPARLMSDAFGGTYICIPLISSFEEDCRRRRIATMAARGFSTKECANMERMSERRVQQICRELEQAGIIAPMGGASDQELWNPEHAGKLDNHTLENVWHAKRARKLGNGNKAANGNQASLI